MVRITVKPGKEIGMGIFFQYPVALLCKPSVIHALIPCKNPVFSLREVILIRDAIRRVSEYQGYITVRNLYKKLHAVHTIYPVI